MIEITRRFARPLALAACVVAGVGGAVVAAAQERVFFGIATGSTGGVYYPLGGMVAQVVSNNAELAGKRVIATAETGNASVANVRLLQRRQIEAGMMGADIADQAFRGKAQFADGAVQNLRAIGALYPETLQLVVRADSDVRSFADLKGKTVSSGPAGSGMYQVFGDLLAAHGLGREDVTEDFSSFTQAADKLRDGNLDAFFGLGGVPTVSIVDLSQGHAVRIVPITGDAVKGMLEEQPYYSSVALPGGTYKGQDDDVPTLAVMSMIVTHDEVDEDLVYAVTKAVYENHETLAKVHVQGRNITKQSALNSVSIPLHPGAERYFREAGVLSGQ